MSLSDGAIREFQEIYEKEYGEKLSRDESVEAANNLHNLFKLLFDLDRIDYKRKLRLKDEPKGFHVTDGSYTCPICGHDISNEKTWYDKYGLKCVLCQKALNKRIIPVSVLKKRDSWYSIQDFSYYFGIKSQSIRKLVEGGVLKSRVIPGPDKRPHFELLLIKDNPHVLSQKPRSSTVQNENGSFSIAYEEVKLAEVLERLKTK